MDNPGPYTESDNSLLIDDLVEPGVDEPFIPEEYLQGLDNQDEYLIDPEEEFPEDVDEGVLGGYEEIPERVEIPEVRDVRPTQSRQAQWLQDFFKRILAQSYKQQGDLEDVERYKQIAANSVRETCDLERKYAELAPIEEKLQGDLQELKEMVSKRWTEYRDGPIDIKREIVKAKATTEQLEEELMDLYDKLQSTTDQAELRSAELSQVRDEVERNDALIKELHREMEAQVRELAVKNGELEDEKNRLRDAVVEKAGVVYEHTLNQSKLATLREHADDLRREYEEKKEKLQEEIRVRRQTIGQTNAADQQLMQEMETRKHKTRKRRRTDPMGEMTLLRMIRTMEGHIKVLDTPQSERPVPSQQPQPSSVARPETLARAAQYPQRPPSTPVQAPGAQEPPRTRRPPSSRSAIDGILKAKAASERRKKQAEADAAAAAATLPSISGISRSLSVPSRPHPGLSKFLRSQKQPKKSMSLAQSAARPIPHVQRPTSAPVQAEGVQRPASTRRRPPSSQWRGPVAGVKRAKALSEAREKKAEAAATLHELPKVSRVSRAHAASTRQQPRTSSVAHPHTLARSAPYPQRPTSAPGPQRARRPLSSRSAIDGILKAKAAAEKRKQQADAAAAAFKLPSVSRTSRSHAVPSRPHAGLSRLVRSQGQPRRSMSLAQAAARPIPYVQRPTSAPVQAGGAQGPPRIRRTYTNPPSEWRGPIAGIKRAQALSEAREKKAEAAAALYQLPTVSRVSRSHAASTRQQPRTSSVAHPPTVSTRQQPRTSRVSRSHTAATRQQPRTSTVARQARRPQRPMTAPAQADGARRPPRTTSELRGLGLKAAQGIEKAKAVAAARRLREQEAHEASRARWGACQARAALNVEDREVAREAATAPLPPPRRLAASINEITARIREPSSGIIRQPLIDWELVTSGRRGSGVMSAEPRTPAQRIRDAMLQQETESYLGYTQGRNSWKR